jgi:acetolactate synthase I/II/III large subunit
VRKAFAVAETEKPGSTHLELPEDVMQRPLDAAPLPRHPPVQPEPGGKELQRAADLIDAARNPLALAGNGAIRGHAGRALRAFVHNTGIPVAETFMAKGLVDYEDPKALGTVGLQARDYEMAGFDEADLVIAIGYDLVEHSPKHWNPNRDKQIIVIDSDAAEVDQNFVPDVELIGDIAHVLARLAAGCSRRQTTAGTSIRIAR